MANYVVPTARAATDILGMMYGDDLEVSEDSGDNVQNRHVATYVSDDDGLVALCACDDEFVIFSGAALSMVPADVAREMVAEKDFSDIVLANFHEVMNICSRLLMSDDSPHLRLDKTLPPTDADAAVSKLGANTSLTSFNVSIPAYGSGNLVFMIS